MDTEYLVYIAGYSLHFVIYLKSNLFDYFSSVHRSWAYYCKKLKIFSATYFSHAEMKVKKMFTFYTDNTNGQKYMEE